MSDPLVFAALVFPLGVVGAGACFLVYALRMRTPADVESDVLAALSCQEALPVALICRREPLAGRQVDPEVVEFTLEHLRHTGRAVRWFDAEKQVYRRVA